VAVDGFDAVFGARRGSESAQVQRDLEERDHALSAWSARVRAHSPYKISLLEALTSFYCARDTEDSKLASFLSACARGGHVSDLIRIVKLGDPGNCPGLTDPAVRCLAQFFATPPREFEQRARDGADSAIRQLFIDGGVSDEPEHYLRLQPLCEGVGALLARPHAHDPARSEGMVEFRAAAVLFSAPTFAAAGPLASWVAALANRAKARNLDSHTRAVLRNIITDQTSDSPARKNAFAALSL
jgi:hypothetical protein